MDYQFKRDLYGKHTAKLSMGHEAFGHWLTDEISNSEYKLKAIQTGIESIKAKQRHRFEFKGHEFDIEITNQEVIVAHHKVSDSSGFHKQEDRFDEQEDGFDDLNDYEQELKAQCGFEDFLGMFTGWVEFVGG